jgi:hypothetical protein
MIIFLSLKNLRLKGINNPRVYEHSTHTQIHAILRVYTLNHIMFAI